MTPHPNAEFLRALADGKRVMVVYQSGGEYPLWECSTTVIMSLLHPHCQYPQAKHWTFHIEHMEPST